MKKTLQTKGFDELDRAILEELQINGRISNADLARKIHLSQPAVHNRIKRLEKRGVIQQYVALLNREEVGYDLLCFIYLNLESHTPESWQAFSTVVQSIPEILECYQVTGEYDVMMKVVAQNRSDLELLIHEKLMILPFIKQTKVNIVMSDAKESTALSLK